AILCLTQGRSTRTSGCHQPNLAECSRARRARLDMNGQMLASGTEWFQPETTVSGASCLPAHARLGSGPLRPRRWPRTLRMAPEPSGGTVTELYERRFSAAEREAKNALWRVLCEDFFQRWVSPDARLVDRRRDVRVRESHPRPRALGRG